MDQCLYVLDWDYNTWYYKEKDKKKVLINVVRTAHNYISMYVSGLSEVFSPFV